MNEPNAPEPDASRAFAPRLVAWQRRQGRHDLPWQGTADPYRVWLSEIMLQQTQVETVIPYYRRFLARFPDLASLAAAPLDDVLALWSGLGYYARGRNLHTAARRIVREHGGVFPADFAAVLALPGVGRSTAAAIAAFCRGEGRAILDGNVKRVLCRVFGLEGWPGGKAVEKRLWRLADSLLPDTDIQSYTQGLMDLGATVCLRSRPRCPDCPMSDLCQAARQGRQGELPTPRPRKPPLPRRTTAMLVILHGGEVLLEKRSASGLWGGLWSLPECPPDQDPADAAARLGLEVEAAAPLPALTHAFTHFRLRITPWQVAARRRASAGEPGRIWLTLDDTRDAALPTPVRRILDTLD